jgi:hypothetical protein
MTGGLLTAPFVSRAQQEARTSAVVAAIHATPAIPIVMGTSDEAVGSRAVSALARPLHRRGVPGSAVRGGIRQAKWKAGLWST